MYTELAPRWLQFHAASTIPALKYTTSVAIQKTRYKKPVTHVEPRASAVRERRIALYKRSSKKPNRPDLCCRFALQATNTLVLWAALTSRYKLAKLLWKRTEEPMAVALVVSMILHRLGTDWCKKDLDMRHPAKETAA